MPNYGIDYQPELVLIDAVTTAAASGTCTLNSPLFQANPILSGPSTAGIRLPLMSKAKLYSWGASGPVNTRFTLQWAADTTIGVPVWVTVGFLDLAAEGTVFTDPGESRPYILNSFTGKEGFQILFTEPGSLGVSHLTFTLEIGNIIEEEP